jgi:ABC-2 type transport system permease protein
MIRSQIALLQRELWEHRSIFVTPIVVAFLLTLIALTGQISINGMNHVDLGIVGASNMPENARGAVLSGIMIGLSSTFVFAMSVLTIFYALDALYSERKDRSILFWRSIPSTDFETVLSKLLTAMLVIPLVTFAMIVVTHLVVLLFTSIWVGVRGGSGLQLIWASAPFFDNWTATLIFLLALPLWLAPFIGWFLFVSAFTKRSPFLVAFLPIAILPIMEKMLFDSAVFAEAIFVRSIRMPLFMDLGTMERLFKEGEHFQGLGDAELSLLGLMDFGGFLFNPGLWLGLIVCGLFTAAAIYVRRYRDDSQ